MLFSNQKLSTNYYSDTFILTRGNIKITAPSLSIQANLKFNPAIYSSNPRSKKLI